MNVMGDDNLVVDAARVSFSKLSDNYTPAQNERLIKYLARENTLHHSVIHTSHSAAVLHSCGPTTGKASGRVELE